jgi:hypothetical protein
MNTRADVVRLMFGGFAVVAGLTATTGRSAETTAPIIRWPPEAGYVPDAETAEQIAEVIFNRFYGAEEITRERPFTVVLRDDVWIVSGNLPSDRLGGVAEIRISKIDGRILHLFHGR